MKNTAQDFLSLAEIRQLQQRSWLRGIGTLLNAWLPIGLCFAIVAQWPSVFTLLPALVIIGGRQLALAILMHESAHRTLFPNRRLNDWVGQWLAAAFIWQDAPKYRQHHLRHHRHTGTAADPDLRLSTGFPISSTSLRRKFLRDISGLTGLKTWFGSILMLIGYYHYSVAGDAKPQDFSGKPQRTIIAQGLRGIAPALITNGGLLAVLWLCGAAWLYLLWLAAYLTPYPLFLRIRSIAEHALTNDPEDALNNARTTHAAWWTRWLWAPMHVNYHLEHHMLMSVPWFQLPKMHTLLRQHGVFDTHTAAIAPNYRTVMQQMRQ